MLSSSRMLTIADLVLGWNIDFIVSLFFKPTTCTFKSFFLDQRCELDSINQSLIASGYDNECWDLALLPTSYL